MSHADEPERDQVWARATAAVALVGPHVTGLPDGRTSSWVAAPHDARALHLLLDAVAEACTTDGGGLAQDLYLVLYALEKCAAGELGALALVDRSATALLEAAAQDLERARDQLLARLLASGTPPERAELLVAAAMAPSA